MCKKIICISTFVIIIISLLLSGFCFVRASFQAAVNHETLEKAYFIGGVISGIFAFLAFFVAVVANYGQTKTGRLQRFETTFFNMLSLQQQIVNDLSFKDTYKDKIFEDAPYPLSGKVGKEVVKDKIVEGREMFYFTFEESEHLLDNKTPVAGMRGFLKRKGINEYRNSYTPTYFDHYFRHLYTIIKFVDLTHFLKHKEKYKYTSMVRATLSRYELIWLYYNCLSDAGNEKFKPLIEKYSLLKNMREDLLTLCKENNETLQIIKITPKTVYNRGFSARDYEFFLTTQKNNTKLYYIGAFYNMDELKKGEDLVSSWKEFISSNG